MAGVDPVKLKIKDDKIHCVSKTGNFFLYATCEVEADEDRVINLLDIDSFNKAISCIQDGNVELEISDNYIRYASASVKLQHYLYDDALAKPDRFDPSKLAALSKDINLPLSKEQLSKIIKASTINPAINKAYFKSEHGQLWATLTDKEVTNTNSMEVNLGEIDEEFEGEIILPTEFVMYPASLPSKEFTIQINNEQQIVLICIEFDGGSALTYVCPGLKK